MRQILLLFLLSLLVSCKTSSARESASQGAGIYYWKTTWQLGQAEQAALVAAGTRQLFLRLFDVDWDFNQGQAQPKGVLQLPDTAVLDTSFSVTPVVFIVERVFRQAVDVEVLAQRVSRMITGMATRQPALSRSRRWQIDCDWTPSSRDQYFQFLRTLQSLNPTITLSVTIRLHQYRERSENGIPPVTEGLLMCYNLEPVQKPSTQDAIYREDLLRGYLKAPPYPLILDGALPIFTWGAAFRDGRLTGIVPAPTASATFLEPAGANTFLVLKDTTLADTYLRPGDVVRLDGATESELLTASQLLRQQAVVRDLIFFDWQPPSEKKWGLKKLWQAFYLP